MEHADLGIEELTDYRVVGTGGFSTVYAAWDVGFERWVAIKVFHNLDEAGIRRFDRERGILGRLSHHPHVITPFRSGYTATGAPYLVMEYVDGGSLQTVIDARGPLPWADALAHIMSATKALGFAHDNSVLHRDVKPDNILLATTGAKLTDFGIAAIRESTASQVAYTLAHCPPETFAGGQDLRDERSDLYSMASTLYTVVAGRAPFEVEVADSQQAYMFRIIDSPPRRLEQEAGPEPLHDFLAAALSKNPSDRPQTAAEFVRALQAIPTSTSTTTETDRPEPADAGATVHAPPPTSPMRPTPPSSTPADPTPPPPSWPAPTPSSTPADPTPPPPPAQPTPSSTPADPTPPPPPTGPSTTPTEFSIAAFLVVLVVTFFALSAILSLITGVGVIVVLVPSIVAATSAGLAWPRRRRSQPSALHIGDPVIVRSTVTLDSGGVIPRHYSTTILAIDRAHNPPLVQIEADGRQHWIALGNVRAR